MTDEELATTILDFLSPGARTCDDVYGACSAGSPEKVEATLAHLTRAGLTAVSDGEPAVAGLTDAGLELLVEAHAAAALPASALKAAVVGRALRERTG